MNLLSKVALFFILMMGAFLPSSSALAATYTVCASGCDFTTIQAAIAASSSGDTIQVGVGTYNENIVIDKNNITLIGAVALNPNDAPNPSTHTIIDSASPASVNSPGITINANVTGVTIKNLRVQNFSSNSGIYGALSNNNLTIENVHTYSNNTANAVNGGGIYMNGPVSNVLITNVDAQFNRSRGIVIWNGFKQNITITNNYVANNNCCGIELQDGTASGVTITGNTVINNSDSGMAVIGLMSGAGANIISNNALTNNGRFGIEIKLPNGTGVTSGDGSIVVENNTVTLSMPPADLRDFAGIAVFRRAYAAGNVDIPTGVVVRNNTVTGYAQNNVGSNSAGFGIVVEGQNITVLNNTLVNNEVGVQIQAGHLPYTANTNTDGDQSDLADDYFGRGNSPLACVRVLGNTYTTNGLDYRVVGSEASDNPPIVNQTKGTYHCGIQEAIDFAAPGDTIVVSAGNYIEELYIDKALTLLGPNSAIDPNVGARGTEAVIHPATSAPDPSGTCALIAYLTTSNITIKGFTFDGDNPNLTSGVLIGSADVDACELIASYEGVGNIVVENNILQNSTYTAVDFYNYVDDTATSGNYIRYNLIQDIGETTFNWGIGVLVYNNFYADITDNVLDNVRTGVQTGNFYQANPGSAGTISNNEINAWRMGIFHNLWYSSASDMPVTNNTITAISSSGATKWNGMLISSFQGSTDTTISNNVINIGVLSQTPSAGYNIWNTSTSAEIAISGGSVSGGDYGVWVNNYEGYDSDAANTSVTIENLTVNGALNAGVYVLDSPSNGNNSTVNALIKSVTISNSGRGVHVANADATAQIRNSTIVNNVNEGIYNDASALTVNSSTLSANGLGNLYNNTGSVSVTNTILANSSSPDVDCFSTNSLVVNANNLVETNSGCGTPALTVDPLLGSLSKNGGLTQTMAPAPGSPVIAAGNNSTCELFDQRGVTRPQGTTCEIGAYEKLPGPYPTFADVPMNAFAWAQIESIYAAGITSGCSVTPLNYCSDGVVTRAQMAIFLMKAIHGNSYTPPPATGTVFNDVPVNAFAAAWIEAFATEGITSGCGGGNFCSNQSVTRAQMAVFIQRTFNLLLP
ncbi:MAG: right-handed parallel beta-helix repeat-containing protein [Anaerolineales bacterium]|nr:right-handed parallel beta-helix repeat-containing protein [Anaerolineales bacterium]